MSKVELPEYWESSILIDGAGPEPSLMLFLSNGQQMLSYHQVVNGNYELARTALIDWVLRSMGGRWVGQWAVVRPEGFVAYDDITERV